MVAQIIGLERLIEASGACPQEQMQHAQDRGLSYVVCADDNGVSPQFEIQIVDAAVVSNLHPMQAHTRVAFPLSGAAALLRRTLRQPSLI